MAEGKPELKIEYGTTSVLKWSFTVNGGGTMTWNLKYPKPTLSKMVVQALSNELIEEGLILFKNNEATDFKDAYIYNTSTVEIPA